MSVFNRKKSYGGVTNGMLYSENAKIINRRLTISVTDLEFDRTILALVGKIGLVYFRVNKNSKEAFWVSYGIFTDTPQKRGLRIQDTVEL